VTKERSLEDILALPRDACEAEPIHRAPGIQPHGALLVVDAEGTALTRSANLGDIVGPAAPVAGERAAARLPEGLAALVRRAAPLSPGDYVADVHALDDGAILYGTATAAADGVLLEVERLPAADAVLSDQALEEDLYDGLRQLRRAPDLHTLAGAAAGAVQRITGFQRVLVYRFDPDGHGAVVGEARTEAWPESLLGFHFPESDIPAQARALYRRSLMRFTPARDYAPVPLEPATDPRTGRPFDLTHARLRSLSPIHQAYQRNLGVDGAMSLSVLDEKGNLWGLIVGHHRDPFWVPPTGRAQAATIAEAFALRVRAVEYAADQEARLAHTHAHARVLERIAGARDLDAVVNADPRALLGLFDATGLAVLAPEAPRGERLATWGRTPPEGDVAAYVDHLSRTGCLPAGVHVTEAAPAVFAPFHAHRTIASGALTLAIGFKRPRYLVWFRPEAVRTTTWGGRPDKAVAFDGNNTPLPRRSFARWVAVQRARSRPWPAWHVTSARSLRTALNGLMARQHN